MVGEKTEKNNKESLTKSPSVLTQTTHRCPPRRSRARAAAPLAVEERALPRPGPDRRGPDALCRGIRRLPPCRRSRLRLGLRSANGFGPASSAASSHRHVTEEGEGRALPGMPKLLRGAAAGKEISGCGFSEEGGGKRAGPLFPRDCSRGRLALSRYGPRQTAAPSSPAAGVRGSRPQPRVARTACASQLWRPAPRREPGGSDNTLASDPVSGGKAQRQRRGGLLRAGEGEEDGVGRAAPGAVRPGPAWPCSSGQARARVCGPSPSLAPSPGGQHRGILWSEKEPDLGEAGAEVSVERRASPTSCGSGDTRPAAERDGERSAVKKRQRKTGTKHVFSAGKHPLGGWGGMVSSLDPRGATQSAAVPERPPWPWPPSPRGGASSRSGHRCCCEVSWTG